jgi:hypothetical protein
MYLKIRCGLIQAQACRTPEPRDAFVISRRVLRIKLAMPSIVFVSIPLLLELPLGPDASSVLHPYVILLFFLAPELIDNYRLCLTHFS